jgi:hypothetical protein
MDETKIAELRKFLNTIADPRISAFIDLKKLCQSGIYNLAVQMATEHAKRHDFTYLDRLLHLLDGSVHVSGFIASLRPKLNFVITDTKPRKFKKATLQQVVNAAEQTQSISATVKKVETKPVKKVVREKVSYDLMDSRLMFPGGYGTGKRR